MQKNAYDPTERVHIIQRLDAALNESLSVPQREKLQAQMQVQVKALQRMGFDVQGQPFRKLSA